MTIYRIFLIISVGALNFSANRSLKINPEQLLDKQDFALQELSNNSGTPLKIQNHKGQLISSYNKWMCFASSEVDIYCAEHVFSEDNILEVPMISFTERNHDYQIDAPSNLQINCSDTLEEWRTLLRNQSSFCVLAAYLQPIYYENYNGKASMWILGALKTANGYWWTPSLSGVIK